jgi:putative ABC transport system ATP-binding protein
MPSESLIAVDRVSHYYGDGALRRQILFDISTEVRRGEIVILTGPSGSGKTTLLTLIGALRSTQQGNLQVLGQELNGATERDLVRVRKNIGYIFQAHNLLPSLTARQNVEMALALHPDIPAAERYARSIEMLQAVGLGNHVEFRPEQLSGGQKQRVAIARALASRSQIILADEPVAALDRKSGRDVADLMRDLAKQRGCTVLLVTHDHRILDIADRIIHLEDGRLSSFSEAVLSNTQQMFSMLAQNNRKGELTRRLSQVPVDEFSSLLDEVTTEFQHFLRLVGMSDADAFDSMLEQVIEAFTIKVGQILQADRATLFLVDAEHGELWSKVAQSDGEKPLDIRVPGTAGIVGHVATTGNVLNVPDAYADPLFNRAVDEQTGYRTDNLLCVPIRESSSQIFAVAELLNKRGAAAFDAADERRLCEFASSIGVVLESWWQMSKGQGRIEPSRRTAG